MHVGPGYSSSGVTKPIVGLIDATLSLFECGYVPGEGGGESTRMANADDVLRII